MTGISIRRRILGKPKAWFPLGTIACGRGTRRLSESFSSPGRVRRSLAPQHLHLRPGCPLSFTRKTGADRRCVRVVVLAVSRFRGQELKRSVKGELARAYLLA